MSAHPRRRGFPPEFGGAAKSASFPQGGTALSEAIRAALGAFAKGNNNHKALVLFTDGEDHDEDAETMGAAKEAADAGLRIFTVGVGTAAGELLQVTDEHGNTSFVKDEDGNVVKSHLNEDLLRRIATATGGFYLPLRRSQPDGNPLPRRPGAAAKIGSQGQTDAGLSGALSLVPGVRRPLPDRGNAAAGRPARRAAPQPPLFPPRLP